MGKNFTRRHLLKFVGGSAAGLLLTPVPWKTLDDVAIWTQNWSWIPVPPKGEIQTRFTTCTLCPAGCGVRARCVGGRPVSLSGVAGHPAGGGSLCPVGLGGHHLPYHPLRLLEPARMDRSGGDDRPVPVTLDAALAAMARVAGETRSGASGGSVAVLDGRPGRTLSTIYRKFLGGMKSGLYLAPEMGIGANALQDMLLEPWGRPGLDLENTATLLSFGAPILDGWGAPGRMADLVLGRRDGKGRRLKLIQVEPRRSRTAAAADQWVPLNPGTEAALAFGLAHQLVQLRLFDEKSVRKRAVDFETGEGSSYLSLISRFTPDTVSGITGVSTETITGIARELARNSPAAVVGGGDPAGGPLGEEEERAIWGLNLLLGSVGKAGGFVPRREAPGDPAISGDGPAAVSRLEEVPDRSIRLLILDTAGSGGALPWKLIDRKLVPQNSLVAALAPVVAGDARRADLVIPVPSCTEALDEVPAPAASPVSTLSLAQPLQPAPAGVIAPAALIVRLAAALSVPLFSSGESAVWADCLKRRVEAIHNSGRGSVFSPQDGKFAEMAAIESPESLWKLLSEGGCWIDSREVPAPLPHYSLLGRKNDAYASMASAGAGRLAAVPGGAQAWPLVLMPSGLCGALDDSQVSPLMTKLYQESGLRRLLNQADINPATARAYGLADRGGAVIETPSGSLRVEVRFDPGVMPGVIHVAVGPGGGGKSRNRLRDRLNVLTICPDDSGRVWRVARARVREA